MPSSSCLDPRIDQEFGAKAELIPCILPILRILHHICTTSETSTLTGKVLDTPQMGVKSDPVEGQGGKRDSRCCIVLSLYVSLEVATIRNCAAMTLIVSYA